MSLIAAPRRQRSTSPFTLSTSPVSLSLLLEERRAAAQNQTVPISPSLSPLIATQHGIKNNSTPRPNRSSGRHSPSPARVPEAGERVFSGSPLLRQILTVGRKRQHDSSPSNQATPSPIATTSKRFCRHCSSVSQEANDGSSLVIINRSKATPPPQKRWEQVVPEQEPGSIDRKIKVNFNQRDVPTNKDGVILLELFAGDEIFAHEE